MNEKLNFTFLIISIILLIYSIKNSLLIEFILCLILISILNLYYKSKESFSDDMVKVATAHNSPPIVNSMMANLASTQNQLDEDSKYDKV